MIFFALIFTLFIIGVGAGFGLVLSINRNISEDNSSEIIKPEDIGVSVAQRAADYCIDTVPGSLIVTYDIPDELPLCIDNDYLNSNFGITIRSFGGYHPDDQGINYLTICQQKTGLGGLVAISWEHSQEVCTIPGAPCEGCLVDYYTAVFTICGGDVIQVDSNHLPGLLIMNGADCEWLVDGTPSPDLDKWVSVSVCTSWEGCHEEDQKFKLIWIH